MKRRHKTLILSCKRHSRSHIDIDITKTRQAVLKATDVDGVYSADPKTDKTATRYDRLTHQDALNRNLKVMDATAFALAQDNRMPIIVFSIRNPGAIEAVLRGEGRRTVVAS